MDIPDIILLDGVKWWIPAITSGGLRHAVPLCPKHNLRLKGMAGVETNRITGRVYKVEERKSKRLICQEDGGHIIQIPRSLDEQEQYVIDKRDAPIFANMKVLNLDDEAIPVATEELKDTNYWVRAKVTKSKSGTRLIVWAGDRTIKNKTQLFVEPQIKRMSFDQNDTHPAEVFAKVEATFANGVTSKIESKKENKK